MLSGANLNSRTATASASPIVGDPTDVNGVTGRPAQPAANSSNSQAPSRPPAVADSSREASSEEFSLAGAGALFPLAPAGTHAFEAPMGKSSKPKAIHSTSDAPVKAPSLTTRSATLPTQADAVATKSSAASSKTSLHIDIVSAVADENVSIFSGDELLLSTPLQASHIGDTLRFECPVTPGEHSFRVVLARSDETVLVEKASTSQIRSGASNFLGVHVSRHAKLFLKHEALLEVVWPSTVAPIAAFVPQHPESELALR